MVIWGYAGKIIPFAIRSALGETTQLMSFWKGCYLGYIMIDEYWLQFDGAPDLLLGWLLAKLGSMPYSTSYTPTL